MKLTIFIDGGRRRNKFRRPGSGGHRHCGTGGPTNTYIKIMVNLIYRPSTQLPGYIPAWDGNCILFCSILVFSSAELPFTHRLKSSTKAIEPLSRKWGLQLGSHCKTGKESRRGGKPEGSPGLGCSSVPIQIDLHKSLLFFLCRGIDPSNNVSGYLSFS